MVQREISQISNRRIGAGNRVRSGSDMGYSNSSDLKKKRSIIKKTPVAISL